MEIPQYDTVVRTRNGQYYLQIKELGLLVHGEDLASTFAKLTNKRDALVKDFQDAGLLQELPIASASSVSNGSGRSIGQELGLFSLKMLMVAVTISVIVFVAVSQVAYTAEKVAAKLETSIGELRKKPFKEIERQLILAAEAENEPSPEKQEKILQSLRVLVKRVKPYVDELRPLFSDR